MCSFRFDSFRFDSFVGFDADAGRPLVTRKSESELVRGTSFWSSFWTTQLTEGRRVWEFIERTEWLSDWLLETRQGSIVQWVHQARAPVDEAGDGVFCILRLELF